MTSICSVKRFLLTLTRNLSFHSTVYCLSWKTASLSIFWGIVLPGYFWALFIRNHLFTSNCLTDRHCNILSLELLLEPEMKLLFVHIKYSRCMRVIKYLCCYFPHYSDMICIIWDIDFFPLLLFMFSVCYIYQIVPTNSQLKTCK